MMRDPTRIDRMLDKIKREWVKNPNLRFLQLLIILNIIPNPKDYFNTEDSEVEYKLDTTTLSKITTQATSECEMMYD